MLIVFFDFYAIVQHECVPERRTATKEYFFVPYVMGCVTRHQALHQDNAPMYSTHLNQSFMTKTAFLLFAITVFVTSGFYLKSNRHWKASASIFERTVRNEKAELISVATDVFLASFQQRQNLWVKCVEAEEYYFEWN